MNPFQSFARRACAASPPPALVATLIAAASLPASPARATITPDAQKIVDRYVEASGGRIAWERTRNGRSVGRIRAFGLEGRVETWRRAPDRRASEVALGPFQ